jgi:hypothetical protein
VISLPRIGDHDARTERSRWPEYALGDDLALRNGQKLEQITDDQVVTLKNGEHFVALPPGTIS